MKKRGQAGTGGVLTRLHMLLEKSRLGELLLARGLLTQEQLGYALARQKADRRPLGRLLVEERIVARRDLYRMLSQQWTMRCMAAAVGLFISFSSFGGVKNARAGTTRDVPAQMKLVSASADFAPVAAYPALFGSAEKRSGNISPFTKWTGMFSRFEAAMSQPSGQKAMAEWKNRLEGLRGLSLEQMAERVNNIMNEKDYIVDSRNWGQTDYWETPVEFMARGGDCEDFAIAKYAALRSLGVPEERLRIAIVHDEQKNIPHAVLIVYTNDDALILDNQNKQVRSSSRVSNYRPIFSINRTAWWLHTAPAATVVASR